VPIIYIMFDLQRDLPWILIVVALVIIVYSRNCMEGYDSKLDSLDPELDYYYQWRAFGPNNAEEVNKYPWNRRMRPHFARFNYFYPGFYEGGYGHL